MPGTPLTGCFWVVRRESTEGTLGRTETVAFHGETALSDLGQLRPRCHALRAGSENEKTTGVSEAKRYLLIDWEYNAP
jgi:hypothetical protein